MIIHSSFVFTCHDIHHKWFLRVMASVTVCPPSPWRAGSGGNGKPAKAKVSTYARKAIQPHQLSNKAILPPHGRGRAPKVHCWAAETPPLRFITVNPTSLNDDEHAIWRTCRTGSTS